MSASATEDTTTGARKRGRSKANATGITSDSQAGKEQGVFVCPECGKSFSRAQALGAHRSRAHGVAGTSRAARAASGRGAAKRRTARSRQRTQSNSPRAREQSPQRGGGAVDRDQLLATLFPSGVPAKGSVIEALAPWLEEAERLARMR
jgi:hypothetical protein